MKYNIKTRLQHRRIAKPSGLPVVALAVGSAVLGVTCAGIASALAAPPSIGIPETVIEKPPMWLLPMGATADRSKTNPKPARLPAVTTRKPIRLPVPKAGVPAPKFAKPDSSMESVNKAGTQLLPPTAVEQETVYEEETADLNQLQKTEWDRIDFDQAVEASLSGARLHSRLPVGRTLFPTNDLCEANRCETNACESAKFYNDFSPTPMSSASMNPDPSREQWVYDAKSDVPTQHPWVEWGRIWYGDGITPRGRNWFGSKNLARPQFYVYGDWRTGIAGGRNAGGRTDNVATRLNLDFDLRLTDSDRFHMFINALEEGGRNTRWDYFDDRFRSEVDLTPAAGYYEGDLGVLVGAAQNRTSPMEIPFTAGLVPLLFQNGIWMEDAATGAAVALPARHSRLLNISNFDATFFALFDQITSDAFRGQDSTAQAFGTAWFIEAWDGYVETGYAYLRDRNNEDRSYHNITASYTRRYWDRVSNSIRVIVNTGQDGPQANRTADGALLLVENSWITQWPLTVVPYANMFVGWDRPQSVARAGGSGGILRNTGINFDTDGLNGLATLDTSASDTAGGSIGIDLIGDDLDRQLLLELTYLTPHGSKNSAVPDDQYAAGARYQFPISNATLLRFDTMYGWRRGLEDVYTTRMEYRWKF